MFMTDLEMSCQQSCVQYFSFLLTMMTDLEMSISPDACISLLIITIIIIHTVLRCLFLGAFMLILTKIKFKKP